MTVSRYLKFGSVEMIQNKKPKMILTAITQVRRAYMRRGFTISTLLMDYEFEPLRGDFADLADMQITLNTVTNDEHVPDIERHIRTLKERTRCIYNTLPFCRMPTRMIIEMVKASNFWLNCFPPSDGISSTLSPHALVLGTPIDYVKHCQLEFGTYAQVHEDHDNSMASRTTGAIALRPLGNEQGGYYFYSLSSGRVLTRNHWTVLPMPNEVIDRVHVLARRSAANGLGFADRHGNPIITIDDDDDDDDDESYQPSKGAKPDHADDEASYQSSEASDPPDDYDNDLHFPDDDPVPPAGVLADPVPIAGVYNDDEALIPEMAQDEGPPEILENPGVAQDGPPEILENPEPDENIENEENEEDNIAQAMDEKYGARTGAYGLRPRRPRDYDHLHATLESIVMTQMNLKKGIKEFGQAGVDAVLKELKQLHDRKVVEPRHATTLSGEEKRDALQYLMFLKEKRNGDIKGRGCADGRKQRKYIRKEDASSPTVAIESVMITSTIDAKEQRDVATVDVPGAFMQADMDDVVHLKLEGKMVELLVMIDPELYRPYVHVENGKKVMYFDIRKALYGTMKAALLFWKKLSDKLEKWGFTVNPYDCCVMNKIINGNQCTVLWHVDDLKISHVDPAVPGNQSDWLD